MRITNPVMGSERTLIEGTSFEEIEKRERERALGLWRTAPNPGSAPGIRKDTQYENDLEAYSFWEYNRPQVGDRLALGGGFALKVATGQGGECFVIPKVRRIEVIGIEKDVVVWEGGYTKTTFERVYAVNAGDAASDEAETFYVTTANFDTNL